MADKYSRLNKYQIEHVHKGLQQSLGKIKQFTVLDYNSEWPNLNQMGGSFPPSSNKFEQQTELMQQFVEWMKNQGISGFGASNANSAQKQTSEKPSEEKVKPEEKKQEKKEKEIFDLILVSFDAAKKITVIKEVRAATNLGLKESKDLVETLPATIKTKVKKDEVKAIMEKIEAAGGKLELK